MPGTFSSTRPLREKGRGSHCRCTVLHCTSWRPPRGPPEAPRRHENCEGRPNTTIMQSAETNSTAMKGTNANKSLTKRWRGTFPKYSAAAKKGSKERTNTPPRTRARSHSHKTNTRSRRHNAHTTSTLQPRLLETGLQPSPPPTRCQDTHTQTPRSPPFNLHQRAISTLPVSDKSVICRGVIRESQIRIHLQFKYDRKRVRLRCSLASRLSSSGKCAPPAYLGGTIKGSQALP